MLKHFRDRPTPLSLPPWGRRGKWDAEKGEERKKKGENTTTATATTCLASARRRGGRGAHVLALYSGYAWLMIEVDAISNIAELYSHESANNHAQYD